MWGHFQGALVKLVRIGVRIEFRTLIGGQRLVMNLTIASWYLRFIITAVKAAAPWLVVIVSLVAVGYGALDDLESKGAGVKRLGQGGFIFNAGFHLDHSIAFSSQALEQ